jgi:Major Facilitator Superfamily
MRQLVRRHISETGQARSECRWARVLDPGLDNLVVVTALAPIREDLHASVEQLSWTVNAYVLSVGVLMLSGAVLGDRLGRRRMFVVGLLVASTSLPARRTQGDGLTRSARPLSTRTTARQPSADSRADGAVRARRVPST